MWRRTDLDDRAVEELLAGRVPPGAADLDDLVAFLGEARAQAHREAPEPSPALARILHEGLTAGGTDAAPTAAPASAPPVAARPVRRRPARRPRLAALGALGLVAKLVLVAGAAAALTTGAGAAGVLPSSVQQGFDAFIGAVTPFDRPDRGSPAPPGDEGPGADGGPAGGLGGDQTGPSGAGDGHTGGGADAGTPGGGQLPPAEPRRQRASTPRRRPPTPREMTRRRSLRPAIRTGRHPRAGATIRTIRWHDRRPRCPHPPPRHRPRPARGPATVPPPR